MNRIAMGSVVVALMLVSCGGKTPEPAAAAKKPAAIAASAAVAEVSGWPSIYESTGTVRAQTSASIAAKVMGEIREVRVQVGERVREGQPLASIDSRDADIAIRGAEAGREEVSIAFAEADSAIAAADSQATLAETTLRRMRDLQAKKSISQQEFDEANARFEAAKANATMARARRRQLEAKAARTEQEVRAAAVRKSYTEIAAPFSGVVVARIAEPGAMAVPGAPLFTIERDGGFRLEANVEESQLAGLLVGGPVSVSIDGIGGQFEARISAIEPAIDAATRTGIVKIALPGSPGLRGGLYGKARFAGASRQVLHVPAAAIVEQGEVQSAFAIVNGLAQARLVSTGARREGRVEILSGLQAGERIVSPAPPDLRDGTPVEVRQ